MEPLLGGVRRLGLDPRHIEALLNAATHAELTHLLDRIARMGQASLYAQELAGVVPDRARHRVGNWRGTFTPGQRCRAIEALAVLGSYESILPLLNALNDSIYQVRKAAEEALIRVCARLPLEDARTRAVYRMLVSSLRALPLNARKVVARILADAPPDLVLAPLLSDGLMAAEWWARREAAWVLGALGDRRATRRLMDALEDSSAAVRGSAAWALGRLDAPVAIPALARLTQDPDEVVRAAAVEALGAQVRRLSVLDEVYQQGLDVLVRALEDRDWSVRHAALDALSAINTPEARLALHRALR